MSQKDQQNSDYGQCPKHKEPAIYVCSVDTCKENRLICEICKVKQTLHFSHHANYIYKLKQFKEFQNSKATIPRLEKGIGDCENYIEDFKKDYTKQLKNIRDDFGVLKKQFINIAERFQNIYISAFEKEMIKYDAKINEMRLILKEYIKEKNHQDSFFNILFHEKKNQNSLENVIIKNSKAFKVRAEIISLRSQIAMNKTNSTRYKGDEQANRKFTELYQYLMDFSNNFFDKLKVLVTKTSKSGDGESLRSSIVSETKSLGMSRVSFGQPVQFYDLSKSQASFTSDFSLQRVQLPNPHPKVAELRDKLPVLTPSNLKFEGPYLYSTGVYHGEMKDGKRYGFGIFIFSDGSLYEGGWDNDRISGYGRLIKKYCYYEGEVQNGKAHGKGNYEDQYRTYAGQWRDDKRSGIGEQQFKMKRKKYTGMFLNDKYNGKGKLTDEEFVYDGKFKDGLFHGDGCINFKNRQSFKGSFQEGLKNLGRYSYPDGSYYDGMFKDNTPNGTGQFYWPDGMKYSGQWKSGVQDGVGVQIHPDGKQLRGLWKNGRWQKWL